MSDEDALLAAVLDDPDDDTVRLAYADWLDEHDRGPQATLIRDGVLAGAVVRRLLPPPHDLLLEPWQAEVTGGVIRCDFGWLEVRRGFVEFAAVPSTDLSLEEVAFYLQSNPLRTVEFLGQPPRQSLVLTVNRDDWWRLQLRRTVLRRRPVRWDSVYALPTEYVEEPPLVQQIDRHFLDRDELVDLFVPVVREMIESLPQDVLPPLTFEYDRPLAVEVEDRVDAGEAVTADSFTGRWRRTRPGDPVHGHVVRPGTESLLTVVRPR